MANRKTSGASGASDRTRHPRASTRPASKQKQVARKPPSKKKPAKVASAKRSRPSPRRTDLATKAQLTKALESFNETLALWTEAASKSMDQAFGPRVLCIALVLNALNEALEAGDDDALYELALAASGDDQDGDE